MVSNFVDASMCSGKKYKDTTECKKLAGEGEFRLVLPRFDNSGRKINRELIENYVSEMNSIFGGSTSWRVGGCYKKNGKFLCEGNVILTSVRDFDNEDFEDLDYVQRKEKLKEDFKEVKNLGKKAAKQFGQDAVMALFDGIEDAEFKLGKRKESLPRLTRLDTTELF